jgi:hypothetical protein
MTGSRPTLSLPDLKLLSFDEGRRYVGIADQIRPH